MDENANPERLRFYAEKPGQQIQPPTAGQLLQLRLYNITTNVALTGLVALVPALIGAAITNNSLWGTWGILWAILFVSGR